MTFPEDGFSTKSSRSDPDASVLEQKPLVCFTATGGSGGSSANKKSLSGAVNEKIGSQIMAIKTKK